MATKKQKKDEPVTSLVTTRVHKILESRLNQINLNWLCYKAGKPYISARLHRGIHEDALSWSGISQAATSTEPAVFVPARVDRSHFIPYASRIVDKVEEHIYGKPIKRDGADSLFLNNADRRGADVNLVMKLLYEYWTVCGWGWLGIDRTSATGEPSRTVAEKERNKDGVFWTAYAPWEVVDWCYEDSGELAWLITKKPYYENADPTALAVDLVCCTLWLPGGGTRFWLNAAGVVQRQEVFSTPYPGIPFRLLGQISDEPHWFDSVEMIAASLLNMESEAHTNLSKGVYSIPVVPSALVEGASSDLGKGGNSTTTATEAKVIVQKVFGRKNPIYEDEASKNITRFVSPEQGDMDAYPNEIERTKKALYEIAGLGISKQKDTADAESADAKQFDHLDINAVLRDIAQQIQRAEEGAIELSKKFDSTFAAYKPVYPTEFSVVDFASMMNGVQKMVDLGIPLAPTLQIALARCIAENIPNTSEEERKKIEQETKDNQEAEASAMNRIARAMVFNPENPAVEPQATV